MAYVQITRTPGVTLEDYHKVGREIGEAPIAGQRSHHAGMADGALHIVDVWDSRADADRFAAERLFPAFERSGMGPNPATVFTTFESEERHV